jgi:hypothetical protein
VRSTTIRGAVTPSPMPSRMISSTGLVVGGRGREPRDVALDAFGRVGLLQRRELADQAGRAPQVADGGQAVRPVLEPGQLTPCDRVEDVQRDPRVVVQRRAVQRGGLLERAAVQALAFGAPVGTGVGESVVVPLVADRRPEQRLELEQVVPVAFDQPAAAPSSVMVSIVPSRERSHILAMPPPPGIARDP